MIIIDIKHIDHLFMTEFHIKLYYHYYYWYCLYFPLTSFLVGREEVPFIRRRQKRDRYYASIFPLRVVLGDLIYLAHFEFHEFEFANFFFILKDLIFENNRNLCSRLKILINLLIFLLYICLD